MLMYIKKRQTNSQKSHITNNLRTKEQREPYRIIAFYNKALGYELPETC